MKSIIKNFFIFLVIILCAPIKSYGLIEVDITRGNLDPLPVAVSPLSIDEKSKKILSDLDTIIGMIDSLSSTNTENISLW